MARKTSSQAKAEATPLPPAITTSSPFTSSESLLSNSESNLSSPSTEFQAEFTQFSDLEGKPLPTVLVNNASQSEMKTALDDAVKKVITSSHQFTQIHTHTDIRLILGWASVLVAAATMAYDYKVGFRQARGVTILGVLSYMLLAAIQTGYSYYVEKNTIYMGKRKSLTKRIETELLSISSQTLPSSFSPSYSPPKYSITIIYRRSTNANKSLLRRRKETVSLPFSALIDENGGVEESRVADWVGWVMQRSVGQGRGSETDDEGKRV